MDYDQLVASLSPDIVARLRRGVETGRWPDGRTVTPEQREHSLQAIIAWEQRHLPEDERTGYIDRSAKERAQARGPRGEGAEAELRWVDDRESSAGGS